MKMRKVSVMCIVVLLTAGLANAATLRYQNSGDWFDVDLTDSIGWQGGVLPGAADTARVNWGGWTGNIVTLDGAAPNIDKFQLGVDESGTLMVGSGGSITTTTDSKVGNNNWVTGTLVINGGTVTNNSWFGVATGNGGTKAAGWDPSNPTATWGPTTGIVEINGGTLNITTHLWMATGGANTSSGGAPTSRAFMTINDDGVVNVGQNIGLGTINASTPSAGGGVATITVNSGGLLNLHHWDDTKSIMNGSVLDIRGTGKVVVGGNRVTAVNNYFTAGKITAYGGTGTISAVFDSGANKTTITATSAMQPFPVNGSTVAEGLVDLAWTNMDPNYPGDPVYVDVWFGTDPTWIPEPNQLLPGYPGHYVDFAKVVVAGQNTTTVNVVAPVVGTAPTTYYWRVDSYIYGAGNINEPNMIEGDVFIFNVTDDFPPTVIIETPDTITWVNEPVQLNATVSDTGASALHIEWTSNPAGAVFSPNANVEDPVVTVAAVGQVTLTCKAWDDLNGVGKASSDTMVLLVTADACDAALEAGADYPMDIAEPFCVVDLADLAAVAFDWLTDYTLTAPTVIP